MNEKDIVAWLEKLDAILRRMEKEQAVIISRMDEDVAQTEKRQITFDMYKIKIEELINKLQIKIDGRTMEMVRNIGLGASAILGVLALLKMVGVI